MKISFIFTEESDLAQVSREDRLSSTFEVPDEVKVLPDIQSRIITIGELVGQFTNVCLHINCADIGLKNHLIKQKSDVGRRIAGLFFTYATASIYFDGSIHFQNGNTKTVDRILTIYSPVDFSFPPHSRKGGNSRTYYRIADYRQDPAMIAYSDRVQLLSESLLSLLNINTTSSEWHLRGFNSFIGTKPLTKRLKQHESKALAARKKQEREEEKRLAREAKLAAKLVANPQPSQPLTHGAGRVVGARPGIYGGVQMRSQLEIRFASELDERGIKWVYEGEALGAASYLVDFYLPDLGAWVEVKGRFEARDRQVLPEISKMLKTERKHRLLVYTGSGKCCVVNPSGFREVERKDFWGELLR